ncbi:MAG: DUF3991 domain-containing protein [Clostridiales bacterium]|nr:DUF3991 domain-containing protein [Clostridiales bacterium]
MAYTKEQLAAARSANLADYFLSRGYDCGTRKNEFHIKGFGGFFINAESGEWHCFSNGEGGKNSIDCLQKMLGMNFNSAVKSLIGEDGKAAAVQKFSRPSREISAGQTAAAKTFSPPERDDNIKRIFAYLVGTRGIDKGIISKLIAEKVLYQDKKGNAVFVHTDENGAPIGAEIHGTLTADGQRFKGVAAGTSGSIFKIQNGEAQTVYAFESAIDLLSFYQLADKDKLQNSALVSMAGLKKEAIKSYLKLAEKGEAKVISCVDNDERGRAWTEGLGLKSFNILESAGVKDWNELLRKRNGETLTESQKSERKGNKKI